MPIKIPGGVIAKKIPGGVLLRKLPGGVMHSKIPGGVIPRKNTRWCNEKTDKNLLYAI